VTDAAPYLALGLSGPHLVELTRDAGLLARWDRLPVAFTVLGIDRIDGSGPAQVTLDASAVGAVLAERARHGRFLVAASPQRDHPYNLARRVVSLAHLSRGRSGVLFGVRDAYAPAGPDGAEAWGGAGLGGGAPLTAATARDAARAVRALEQSWPHDSIIGDRETGILVQSDRIVHVDHDGAFRIEGPLNAPEPSTGASVVGWYAASADEVSDDSSGLDLLIGEGGDLPVIGVDDDVPVGAAAGVLLRPANDRPLADVLAATEHLLAGRLRSTAIGGTLRSALGLAPAPDRRASARSAFPTPQPHPSL
jgi:hypothetical protein